MSFEIIAVIIMAGVLAIVLRSHGLLSSELNRLRRDKELAEDKARQRAEKIIEDAKYKALDIVEDAQIKKQKGTEEIDDRLEKVSEDQINKYKQVLHNISKSVEDGALREMQEFKKTLEMETLESQKIIGKRIEEQYSSVAIQLEEYRLRKLSELDEKTFAVLKKLSKDVLGKTLSADEHADLIIKGLEEAKREHIV